MILLACEQAFGRAGNKGEGKAALSLPFPCYFIPLTESLFTGYDYNSDLVFQTCTIFLK